MDSTCVFCGIWRDYEDGVRRDLHDTPIADLGSFFLVSALGPLTLGHVLLVGKSHVASLAALGASAIEEYERHVKRFRMKLGLALLEAEHGSNARQTGGACIDHVHVALMPDECHAVTMLDGKLPLLAKSEPLAAALPVDRPYIFLRGNDQLRVFDACGVPSQLIRREWAQLHGHEEWDWALFDRPELLQPSLAIWQDAFQAR